MHPRASVVPFAAHSALNSFYGCDSGNGAAGGPGIALKELLATGAALVVAFEAGYSAAAAESDDDSPLTSFFLQNP